MLIEPSFPVQGMSGKDPSKPGVLYQSRKGITFARATAPADNTNNVGINNQISRTQRIRATWTGLSTSMVQTWVDLSVALNLNNPIRARHVSPWNMFLSVNTYQDILSGTFRTSAPSWHKNIRPLAVEVVGISVVQAFPYVFVKVDLQDMTNAWAVVWVTFPHSNFQHAFRFPELKMISGHSGASFYPLLQEEDFQGFKIENPAYSMPAGSFAHVQIRVLSDEMLPFKKHVYPVTFLENKNMISLGNATEVYTPAQYNINPVQMIQGFIGDANMTKAIAVEDGARLVLPLKYGIGSELASIQIYYKTDDDPGNSLDVSLGQIEVAVHTGDWALQGKINMPNTGGVEVDVTWVYFEPPYVFESEDFEALIIDAHIATGTIEIYEIRVLTTKRTY